MGMQSSNYAQLKTLNKKIYFLIPINFVLSRRNASIFTSSSQIEEILVLEIANTCKMKKVKKL
jgi:hypothetical protein